jgi:hypothetical protein
MTQGLAGLARRLRSAQVTLAVMRSYGQGAISRNDGSIAGKL